MHMNRHISARRTIGALLPLVLFAAACTSSSEADTTGRNEDGEVVEGGQVGVFRLQEGDCVRLPAAFRGPTEGTDQDIEAVGDFEAVPCDESHDGEVVLVDDDYFADLAEFPPEVDSTAQAEPACITALDEYTGTEFASSTFTVLPLVPSSESWDAIDDRGLICIGITLNAEMTGAVDTTGSIRADS
jgi:hypothetical protein